MQDRRIFSGYGSTELWQAIWAVGDKTVENALYILGCRCQELEAIVAKQGELIEALLAKQEDKTDL